MAEILPFPQKPSVDEALFGAVKLTPEQEALLLIVGEALQSQADELFRLAELMDEAAKR